MSHEVGQVRCGGADQGKVEYGARGVHLSHFMRHSEPFLIRADRETMLNRSISSRSVDRACFGAQNHPATTGKTPHLNTPENPYTILDLPWSPATTGVIEDYLDVFPTFFEHETFTLDVPRRELSIGGVCCHQKCHVPLQITKHLKKPGS